MESYKLFTALPGDIHIEDPTFKVAFHGTSLAVGSLQPHSTCLRGQGWFRCIVLPEGRSSSHKGLRSLRQKLTTHLSKEIRVTIPRATFIPNSAWKKLFFSLFHSYCWALGYHRSLAKWQVRAAFWFLTTPLGWGSQCWWLTGQNWFLRIKKPS